MLSINTNLSSLIAQSSLKNSTNILNQAIERMSTGYKINHAKDNAANYSIATNMSTQLNAYDVAADNVAMGMDLVTTAMDLVSMMQDRASRLQTLSTQARNGTYGSQSLNAINSEAAAIMAEINRLYSTAEYNDISLFNRKAYEIADHLPQAGASGFIDETALISMASASAGVGAGEGAGIAQGEIVGTTTTAPVAKAEYNGFIENPKTYTQAEVDAMTSISTVIDQFRESEYKISTAEELAKLAELANDGIDTSGVTFVLAKDIDLAQWCADHEAEGGWTPIFFSRGVFDGNGHVIKNLKIDREVNSQGLFAYTENSEIKNLGLQNVNVVGSYEIGGLIGYACGVTITNTYVVGNIVGSDDFVGCLVGYGESCTINNSYTIGTVSGVDSVGGLVGIAESAHINNSFATVDVSGVEMVGGLTGHIYSMSIYNSYASGSVDGATKIGGLVGGSYDNSSIINSFASGFVTGTGDYVGGLLGSIDLYSSGNSFSISNSYATGDVIGHSQYVGGLVGNTSYKSNSIVSITNSYATGNVTGFSRYVGGLVGQSYSAISNCYATGEVNGTMDVGGLVGCASSGTSYYISNSYATGDVISSDSYTGGLVGQAHCTISNSYATGNVTSSDSSVGGLIGASSTPITNCYARGAVSGTSNIGGLVGFTGSSGTISGSYATGAVSGNDYVGGLAGYSSSISNSYATGDVSGTSSSVGGLTGHASSSISNSYATGTVSGTGRVGGLAGSSSSITNSYATGNVSGTECVGGLAGSSSSITNSYATGNVSGTECVGGLAGYASSSFISNSYATGAVNGTSYIGGLVGQAWCPNENVEINDSASYSTVNGNTTVGSLVGGVIGTYQYNWNYGDGDEGVDEYSDGELLLTNCSAINKMDYVGGRYKQIEYDICYEDPDTGDWIENYDYYEELDTTFDRSVYDANITAVNLKNIMTNLLVGINGDSSCQMNFDTNFAIDLSGVNGGIETVEAFNSINDFLNLLSEKSTQLGAVQNRLESALDSIEVNINNLTSSRSTIRDADLAEESATYIQQQILQQAAATLMSTANQSPAIALQLI